MIMFKSPASQLLSAVVLGMTVFLLIFACADAREADPPQESPIGYSDTPMLPHVPWKVHDIDRPRPEVVTPGATDREPPSDAIVIFDGTDLSNFIGVDGKEPAWKVGNGYMEMTPTGDLYTKDEFGSCQLHLEWRAPTPPQRNSQHRSNSGVFLMDHYEIQIMDCYDNLTYADGHAGSVYGQYPPLVNANRKPGEWQSFDIIFTAPVFEDDKLEIPAYVTVLLNGILVQNHVEILGAGTHRKVPEYVPHGPKGPIRIQDHKDNQEVRFRNIWVRPLDGG
jgi:hypothetical protein